MTEREIWSYTGKNIKAKLKDDQIIEGFVVSFTSSVDNEPDESSISVRPTYTDKGLIELYASEIISIEILKK